MSGSSQSPKYVAFDFEGQSFQLTTVDTASVIDSSFVYPTFKSVKGKEMKEISKDLIFHYKCDSDRCNFPLTALKESSHLKRSGIKQTAEVIVDTIDSNQQLFVSKECGGYIFQAVGKSMVLIQNDSVIPNDETCFGFIDLTEARRKLIHKYEFNKLRNAKIFDGVVTTVVVGVVLLCIL